MSVRTFTADQLPRVAREFTTGRTVIHVVPATDNVGWAATRTWELARSCASGERRVALIDLSLDSPALDLMAQNTTDEGIVDAFLYGVSLSHVARQQDVPSLYYVGVGTRTNEPAEVWASRRWERLAKGFQNEKAVLIVYVPPGALNRCALEADGMIVLAPTGYDPALDVAPGIARKLKEGTPLIGVITAAADVVPPPTPIAAVPEPEPEPQKVWDVSPPEPSEPAPISPDPEDSPLRVSIPVVQPMSPIDETPIEPVVDVPVEDLDPIDLAPVTPDDVEETVLDLEPPVAVPSDDVATEPILPVVPDDDLENDDEDFDVPKPAPPPRPSGATVPDTPYDGPPIFEPSKRRPVGNTLFLIGGALTVAAVGIGYVMWNGRDQTGGSTPTAQATETVPVVQDTTTLEPVAATPPPAPVEPLTEADSLYYSVQAAALNSLEDAMEHGRSLQQGNRAITVSPVRISGRIWYRVIVGAYASPTAADAGRRSLWQDGLVDTGDGTILRTPQAFSLGRRATIDSARVEAASLWTRGIPAYVLPHDDGGIVLVGAFVRPDQATIAESMLTAASLATTLAPRLGSTQ